MSRAKRTRKAKMARRQAARAAHLGERYAVACARHAEAIERSRFRTELNESDVPDAVKTLVGAFVDPAGFVVDMIEREAKRPIDGGRD